MKLVPSQRVSLSADPRRFSRDSLVSALQDAGATLRGNALRCPFHDDRNPSAAIYADQQGVWRFKCHGCGAGGDVFDIEKLATGSTTFPAHEAAPDVDRPTYATLDELRASIKLTVEATYVYRNAAGHPHMAALRLREADGKSFRLAHVTSSGRWVQKSPGKPWPLWNLSAVQQAKRVTVVEGEKCAMALEHIGMCATTSAGGSKNAASTDWTPLAGKIVVLWRDFDATGLEYIRDVAAILARLAPPVDLRVVDVTGLGLPPKGDVCDLLAEEGEEGSQIAREAVYDAEEVVQWRN